MLSLEALFTSPNAFGLTTASSLQRAIMRASEGKDLGLTDDEVSKYFGTRPIPGLIPSLMVLVCGVRSGKSLMAVCAALSSALNANLKQLLSHERARAVVVAPTLQNAENTFRLLVGAINTAPALKALVVGEPTSDKITIRRADGRFVDIVVVAAHRGAVALRGTWLCAFVLEECCFFGDSGSGYVVSAEELLRAASTRLVPGGQGWIISSPMGPSGVVYDIWRESWGKPGNTIVVHAPTPAMNPAVSKGMIDEIRKRDPDAAAREYDALWSDSDLVLISSSHIDAAKRSQLVLPPEEGQTYVAAMDPATRGNAWTLVVGTNNNETPRQVVVLVQQWVGSKVNPLDPDEVLGQCTQILHGYGISRCATDQWSADAIRVIARRHGLTLYDITSTNQDNVEVFTSMATKFADGEIEIPDDPYLIHDLQGIRKKVSSRISIVLPKTPDGRHCDYAPSLARVLAMGGHLPRAVPPKYGTPEWNLANRAGEKAWARGYAKAHAKKELKEVLKRVKLGDKRILDT